MKVEFYRHQLDRRHIEAIGEVFDSVFLTTGPKTKAFEEAFAAYFSVEYAVGLSSCTAGLFLCLTAKGIGPGDEVIVPAMTFVATANAVIQTGATPVFCDIDPETGLMEAGDVKQLVSAKTKAVIPVHLYGQMCDMKAFRKLADENGLFLLEDAAHCVEGMRDGIAPGQLGDAACFSFYATKNLTSGEGGAVVTNDGALANDLMILRLHGLDRDAANRYQKFRHFDMPQLGYKFNMNDIQAAMLLPQLPEIAEKNARREAVHQRYIADIKAADIPVKTMKTVDSSRNAHHLFVIRVDEDERDNLITWMQEHEVGVAVNYRAVHLNSFYQNTLETCEGMFPHAEAMGAEVISLPMYPQLSEEKIDHVIATIQDYFKRGNS